MPTNNPNRVVTGVVQPYREIGLIGEQVAPGAFGISLIGQETRIGLMLGQGPKRPEAAVGMSRRFIETDTGLIGEFVIKPGDVGDRVLADLTGGYLTGMAAEIAQATRHLAPDGTPEITRARLIAVALVGTAHYDGARILGIGAHAPTLAARAPLLAAIRPRPDVNLTPY